jgi:hypothetical protein
VTLLLDKFAKVLMQAEHQYNMSSTSTSTSSKYHQLNYVLFHRISINGNDENIIENCMNTGWCLCLAVVTRYDNTKNKNPCFGYI